MPYPVAAARGRNSNGESEVIEQSVTGQVAEDNPSEGETEKKGVEDERQSRTGIPGSNSSTGEV
jgi:hypothetical protein